ncbi:hypothetical protein L208DRAFT_1378719 [Tricholoma matsutake]|nr:hypothetical protein L208DRAFT_1378719 [Tricholoma matsutake 945]
MSRPQITYQEVSLYFNNLENPLQSRVYHEKDERAVDRQATYHGYAWSLKGHQATRKAFFSRGQSLSQPQTQSLSWIIAASINIQPYCSKSSNMGCTSEFLPPYSPDYNPIELNFSAMKYHLHRNGEYPHLAMTELGDKVAGVFGWYHQCSFVK